MDGLLINSKDIVTNSIDEILEKYEKPLLTPLIRAKLMGVPDSSNGDVFHDWAKLPISREQWARELKKQMYRNFPNFKPITGSESLLRGLGCSQNAIGNATKLALASSAKTATYNLKPSNLETKQLFGNFKPEHRILGDDPRLRPGRGKPEPDIYLIALEALNASAKPGEAPITPSEYLVFEDSVVGVEAGRRAGMRVIWVPHPDLASVYCTMEDKVLAGGTGRVAIENESQLGELIMIGLN
ncbi:hypothetical protein S40293_10273 [Stachybotrys chartarum IBT 40293]|nr:hypothetical protein S40293_10273 [Stachybotrys chartarum IBT 40293]